MFARLDSRVTASAIAMLLTVLATVALVTAYSYSRSSGLFPIFVGWIFVALTLLELAVQLKALTGAGKRILPEADAAESLQEPVGPLRQFGGFLWLGLLLVVLYVAGFLIAIPVFMFAFLRISADRTALQSASVAIVATALIYAVFVSLLAYRLYPGVLFGG